MKKIFLSLLVCSIAFVGCKKKSDDPPVCESTVAAIAGAYKITKVVANPPGLSPLDITATYLSDPCEISGSYQLNANKTVVYSETASCLGNGSGTWDVVGTTITITHNGDGAEFSGTVTSFNCSNLVIRDATSGTILDFTLTKQ